MGPPRVRVVVLRPRTPRLRRAVLKTYLVRGRNVTLISRLLGPRVFCIAHRRLVCTTLRTVFRTNAGVSVLATARRLHGHKGLSSTKKPFCVARLDDQITDSTRLRCRTHVIRRGCVQERVVIKFDGLLALSNSRAVSLASALISTRGLLSELRKTYKRGQRLQSVSALVRTALIRTRKQVQGGGSKIANVPAKLARLSGVANK